MTNPAIELDKVALNDLLRDSGILKVVTAINLASISILELLEYDVTRQDINRAFAKGVIAFDKSYQEHPTGIFEGNEVGGDHYFRFLSSKVKLTDIGIFLLETIESEHQFRYHNEPSISIPERANLHLSMPETGPMLLK